MRTIFKLSAFLVVLILLSGCVAAHDRRLVKQMEKMVAPYDNGSIFKVGFNERPLFEERRARNVGDGLIMNVPETLASTKKAAEKDKNNKESDKDKVASKDENSDSSKGDNRKRRSHQDEDLSNIASDALVGSIPMTVIQVLDNGNLFVAGGKQVIVDDQDKYVNITGVVDPAYITGSNVIQSTLVSDVRIQVDELRIHSDGTATNFSEGQSTFGNSFQSMRQ